ncbi:ABC-2 type transport system ATP-binding protein [Microbacterium terrae]|uniref:ABC transporter ATP-binding protein YbhF n=1 Tax=Microbacterium terrae TaxID=69369 RepID=A0A0M2HFP2_9MICO|nr:ATP-binding cassette domain-containing protein [Microbacterium terrae]KJL45487.1 putative ABC transporter ATP-binding protein YbhF [Microbacterium terrae]MBP1078460.1 ABC-2 type transport system ATP-binding protein [Microbacterium terrae]GLJ99360.1 ABC transporter ATP-binding protein [Microbacterium terrae]
MSGAEVTGIRVSFGSTLALDDATLAVPAGEVTAVVGGDGAGKSTLLRVLAGRVAVDAGAVRSVDSAHIGYQPATSGVWGNLSVIENVDFVGRSYGMAAKAIRSRGDELLERAGLVQARGRLGRDLSGGMRQKLGFVLAILHAPALILLDEPSTGVDPVSRVELWRLISAAATGDTAVLLATTYLDEAQRAASVTALDAGRVLVAGTPDTIIAGIPGAIGVVPADSPAGERTWRRGAQRHVWSPDSTIASPVAAPDLEDALIALTLSSRMPVEAQSLHPRREARAQREAGAQRETSELPSGEQPAAHLGDVLAEGRAVTRRFGAHVAVDDVSLQVRAGEIVGLIGANGAGKTTFLRALIGLDAADSGEALLFGRTPDAASRRRLGYVPQGLGLYRTLSVRENVEFAAQVYGVDRVALPDSIASVERKPVNTIGLGRQRQLAFALALAHDPDLLVLDEPTSGVDPLSRARLWDIIHAQADAGRGVIVTTHYLQEAEQCSRLALMSQGKLLGMGAVDDLTAGVEAVLVTAPEWQRAFTALSAAGLPTMLSGRTVRVAGTSTGDVRAALEGIDARVEQVAPTLEEAMVLLEA